MRRGISVRNVDLLLILIVTIVSPDTALILGNTLVANTEPELLFAGRQWTFALLTGCNFLPSFTDCYQFRQYVFHESLCLVVKTIHHHFGVCGLSRRVLLINPRQGIRAKFTIGGRITFGLFFNGIVSLDFVFSL